ncbi:metallopeptidase [Niveomyces insectorum RCEF 264]|uniref:Metallopeptidase n=1 Tax=Niveomyces insectorum RCEF 264 TaxID=1081102 RepID=A0A167RBC0_9HYPO|nr:metallopeptidase [Niveomyces insectorum RCEF 264]
MRGIVHQVPKRAVSSFFKPTSSHLSVFQRILPIMPTATQTRAVQLTSKSYSTTPRINGGRLMDAIHSTCEFGQAHRYGDHCTETGMNRLSLNDDDKKVRLWLIDQVKAIGCSVTVDQMGNIFAVRPGKTKTDAPPVYMGSHLDTQMTGGRYDGILGVQAALEALRTLHDNNVETEGPIGLVNWTNEEGARFPMVTVSSGVWAGVVPLETAWNCREITAPAGAQPQSMKEELQRIGFLGETPASHEATPMAAHFELHIEQGPILEQEREKIGVVVGAQGYSWYEVTVRGRDSHAGTTPLAARRDAVLAAAKMIVASNAIAHECEGVITTAVVNSAPGTINTIAHTARFTLDIRHPKAAALATMVDKCQKAFAKIATEDSARGVEVVWTCLTENAPVVFHPDCVAAIEQAAEEEVGAGTALHTAAVAGEQGQTDKKLWRPIWSGAGHDSCNASKQCPAGMVFTPTRDGMSHTPTEYCSPEDCILGAQVLLGAVLRFDAARKL